jgi:hypothetical protein
MAVLRRHRDGEGHYGARVEARMPGSEEVVAYEPTLGATLLVGTITAGMFSSRDWWMTTPITKILESTDDKVVFETKNSTYTLER